MGNELTWMGVIPEDWKSCPLKYIFEIQKRIAGKEGYTVLSITQSGIKPKNMSAQGQYAQDYSNYQHSSTSSVSEIFSVSRLEVFATFFPRFKTGVPSSL